MKISISVYMEMTLKFKKNYLYFLSIVGLVKTDASNNYLQNNYSLNNLRINTSKENKNTTGVKYINSLDSNNGKINSTDYIKIINSVYKSNKNINFGANSNVLDTDKNIIFGDKSKVLDINKNIIFGDKSNVLATNKNIIFKDKSKVSNTNPYIEISNKNKSIFSINSLNTTKEKNNLIFSNNSLNTTKEKNNLIFSNNNSLNTTKEKNNLIFSNNSLNTTKEKNNLIFSNNSLNTTKEKNNLIDPGFFKVTNLIQNDNAFFFDQFQKPDAGIIINNINKNLNEKTVLNNIKKEQANIDIFSSNNDKENKSIIKKDIQQNTDIRIVIDKKKTNEPKLLKKKRGRRQKNMLYKSSNPSDFHSGSNNDNIKSKIKTQYQNFLVFYINELLSKTQLLSRFVKIAGDGKKVTITHMNKFFETKVVNFIGKTCKRFTKGGVYKINEALVDYLNSKKKDENYKFIWDEFLDKENKDVYGDYFLKSNYFKERVLVKIAPQQNTNGKSDRAKSKYFNKFRSIANSFHIQNNPAQYANKYFFKKALQLKKDDSENIKINENRNENNINLGDILKTNEYSLAIKDLISKDQQIGPKINSIIKAKKRGVNLTDEFNSLLNVLKNNYPILKEKSFDLDMETGIKLLKNRTKIFYGENYPKLNENKDEYFGETSNDILSTGNLINFVDKTTYGRDLYTYLNTKRICLPINGSLYDIVVIPTNNDCLLTCLLCYLNPKKTSENIILESQNGELKVYPSSNILEKSVGILKGTLHKYIYDLEVNNKILTSKDNSIESKSNQISKLLESLSNLKDFVDEEVLKYAAQYFSIDIYLLKNTIGNDSNTIEKNFVLYTKNNEYKNISEKEFDEGKGCKIIENYYDHNKLGILFDLKHYELLIKISINR